MKLKIARRRRRRVRARRGSRCGVFGDPGPRLDELAEEVQRRLALRAGLDRRRASAASKGSEEIEVVVDRDRAARYGPRPPPTSRDAVALFFRGRPLSRFRGPEGEVQVQARLAEADRSSLERLRERCRSPADATARAVPLGGGRRLPHGATRRPAIERQQRRSVVAVRGDVDSEEGRRGPQGA